MNLHSKLFGLLDTDKAENAFPLQSGCENRVSTWNTVHNRNAFELAVCETKTSLCGADLHHLQRVVLAKTFEADPFASREKQKATVVETRDTLIGLERL